MTEYSVNFARGFTLHEALAMIEDDNFVYPEADLVLLPPVDGVETDEDSGDEDKVCPDNLPSRQLQAHAEICVTQSSDENFDEEDNLPLATFCRPSTQQTPKIPRVYQWTTGDLIDDLHPQHEFCLRDAELDEQAGEDVSPRILFYKFFDDDLFKLLVQQSNNYASKTNKTGKSITIEEMRAFVGILILSGYVALPRRKLFWEKDIDTHNQLVANSLSRDRFDYIMKVFHMADNDHLDKSDKFSKIRPIFELLNKNFLKFAIIEETHSVDEAMVPYFGRHGCKQFIKGKPIRWGYKFWVGTTRRGYINWFEPYQGASTNISPAYKEYGIGAGVVLSYVDALRSKWKKERFHLFFDNFFTSMTLMECLSTRNIRGTGTIRSNRIPKNPLKSSNEMKKMKRGTHDSRVEEDKGLIILSWNDNSVVSLCSNAVGVNPICQAKRYSQKEKKNITIPQPYMVHLYNLNMGGVDRCDQNISLYRCGIRGKKWYFPLFCHCIDMSIQNAWQLHKDNGGSLDHLAFRRFIARSILQSNCKVFQNLSTGRPSQRENCDSRFDRLDHLVVPMEKQLKCRHCHQKTTTKCRKCDVGVHVRCFVQYHTK